MIIGLISQIFLVGNGWGVDGFAIPRFRRVSSSVARGVLIGGEGCSHRWRRVSSSVADDIFIGGKSTGKGDVSGKKDGGAVRNPGLSSILYGNELNYKLRIRHGLHGFHGFSAMINYVKQPSSSV